MNSNFRKYTDNLAVTLENKNKAYGDSLEDTLLDMAGYAILGLKYLKEHESENTTH